MNESILGAGWYSYLPAGMTHRLISEQGCFALLFVEGPPDYVMSADSMPGAKLEQALCLNSTKMAWEDGNVPELHFKTLRIDPENGDLTWLVVALPGWCEIQMESHPTI